MLRRSAASALALRRAVLQAAPAALKQSSASFAVRLNDSLCQRDAVAACLTRGFCASGGSSRPDEGDRSSDNPASTSGKGPASAPVGSMWVQLVKAGVEESFDERDFSDGAADAFIAVMEKFAERDISGLEPLTTKAVRDAFEGTWQQYDAQGLSMKFEVNSVKKAVIIGGGMSSDETLLEEQDPTREPQLYTMRGYSISQNKFRRLYLMMKVRFDSVETVELTEQATGKVSAHMEDRRGHVWYFAREVPPEMPVRSLDSPWRMVRLE